MGKYVIKQGDTLSEIAKANGTTVEELASLNGIKNVDLIQAGATLELPSSLSSSGNQATNTKPTYTAPTYTKPNYVEGETVKQAQNALNSQLAQKPGAYQSQWQTQLDDTMNKILNREKFSFDLNGDALYQQMADEYSRRGNLAMMDTMGQAAAMTGGYGNSYAQSVGQQAYQAHLQELNEVIPEIYQMQIDKYNMEGQELYNQAAMLGDREALDYGRYRDAVADYLTERDYLTGRYDSERDFDYGKYVDDRDFGYNQFVNDRNFDYGSYRDAVSDYQWQESYDYQQDRDKVLDEQWQKEYDLAAGKVEGKTEDTGSTLVPNKGHELTTEQVKNLTTERAEPGKVNNSSDVSQEIKDKAASFSDNDALDDYLTKQYQAGKITEEQMGNLYIENETPSLSNRNWTAGKNGGINWFGGIDNNASVKDQYGNEYSLDKLVDALVAEGMSKKDAKAYVKKLQGQLGL